VLPVLASLLLAGAAVPAWWTALPNLPRLESDFTQESESAVFGKLRREGHLRVAKGGLLRVEYKQGVSLQADGRALVQYDPDARTAQQMDLATALADMPLLNVLLDPSAVTRVYEVRVPAAGKVVLHPRKPGLPEVEITGEGGQVKRLRWLDGTGAQQVLVLAAPRVPPPFAKDAFRIKVPEGTRWIRMK
jgi:outer membrane lipoprotein-sorting protein